MSSVKFMISMLSYSCYIFTRVCNMKTINKKKKQTKKKNKKKQNKKNKQTNKNNKPCLQPGKLGSWADLYERMVLKDCYCASWSGLSLPLYSRLQWHCPISPWQNLSGDMRNAHAQTRLHKHSLLRSCAVRQDNIWTMYILKYELRMRMHKNYPCPRALLGMRSSQIRK